MHEAREEMAEWASFPAVDIVVHTDAFVLSIPCRLMRTAGGFRIVATQEGVDTATCSLHQESHAERMRTPLGVVLAGEAACDVLRQLASALDAQKE